MPTSYQVSYHHIQYTISREEDLPAIPTSYHHQLPSHLILSQERRTYILCQHHIIINYHHIQYTISREEDLLSIPTSYQVSYRHIQYTILREEDLLSIPTSYQVSYRHIQYTILREEDLLSIPTSYHHQLQSHLIYHFRSK